MIDERFLDKNQRYHVQRVVSRAAQQAQDSLMLARNTLLLLQKEHPEGLEGGWSLDDLEWLETKLSSALGETGEFFHYLS